jgi:hypothetical protein
MKIKIKTQEDNYFLKLMLILNNIPPFDKLRPQELELYSHLLRINYKYRNIPFKERNKLIFTYDVKRDIASKMGIKRTGVYNIISSLKNLKIIESESLIPKYTLGKTKELLFVFEEDD